MKRKDQLAEAVQQQLGKVFEFLEENRLAYLRSYGDAILGDFRLRHAEEVDAVREALDRASEMATNQEEMQRLERWVMGLQEKVESFPG
jgi:hypothetical protein